MSQNPMADLKRPRGTPSRDRRISGHEIAALTKVLDYSEQEGLEHPRQRLALAFLFAIETAMRRSEICSLRSAHINLKESTAFLPYTKNGRSRYVPLSKEAVRLLKRLEPWEEEKTIFSLKEDSISTLFRRAVKKAEIENMTFHDTRHEAITRLAGKLELLDLARMVGHRDIRQLQTYYNRSAADMAKVLNG